MSYLRNKQHMRPRPRCTHRNVFKAPRIYTQEDHHITYIIDSYTIQITWFQSSHIPSQPSQKAAFERLVAEAALSLNQTEVHIRSKLQNDATEGGQVVHYDRHILVWFPKMKREAHVYVGPTEVVKIEELRVWRREGRVAVVLC
ncbi:uncharacterized protein LY89DRAFT_126000 [Mollisia scopiformis]|uniref:Uncharacterized protein n=1 Tax=Mollisia scopiformis TaxID=149040 RepID=A0A194X444_MOLSC|nr:uncharacterized protein LY89DRAFT_126000 [Mollisia scopiformis]KUJ14953.1 hypothetical protein LY89DRAFT_126000 [Mollisia scopiformis]